MEKRKGEKGKADNEGVRGREERHRGGKEKGREAEKG